MKTIFIAIFATRYAAIAWHCGTISKKHFKITINAQRLTGSTNNTYALTHTNSRVDAIFLLGKMAESGNPARHSYSAELSDLGLV